MVLLALLLEVGTRAVVVARGDVAPAGNESLRNEWEWAAEHLAAGRAVLDSTLAWDPELGWRNAPGLGGQELTTNAQGWRAARDFAEAKPPGVRRLVFVGDSYTFGQGVADDETFAARCQQRLGPGWEVLNFAVPGYGTDQQLLCYERVARDYAPDVVVLGFFLRDYSRNLLDFRTYAKPRFTLDGEGLAVVGVPVIEPQALFELYASGERRVGGGEPRSWALAALEAGWARWRERSVSADSVGWQLVARMQRRFFDAVRADGARPLWLLLPTDEVVAGAQDGHARLSELSIENAARIGLPSLDLAPLFREHDRAHPDDSFHRPPELGGHLSATGHALVADALVAWLRAE